MLAKVTESCRGNVVRLFAGYADDISGLPHLASYQDQGVHENGSTPLPHNPNATLELVLRLLSAAHVRYYQKPDLFEASDNTAGLTEFTSCRSHRSRLVEMSSPPTIKLPKRARTPDWI